MSTKISQFQWLLEALKESNNSQECMIWPFVRTYRNYGKVGFAGRSVYTHRKSFEIRFGPIPKGLFVCHRCDNPPCFNPVHLFAGSQKDNVRDMLNKGRRPIESRNLKLTAINVIAMRHKHSLGMKFSEIAKEYGVTACSARSAIIRETWKHIP